MADDGSGKPKTQTAKEMTVFREMNGGGKKWLPGKFGIDHFLWYTEDYDLQADYDVEGRTLSVCTAAYAERHDSKK